MSPCLLVSPSPCLKSHQASVGVGGGVAVALGATVGTLATGMRAGPQATSRLRAIMTGVVRILYISFKNTPI